MTTLTHHGFYCPVAGHGASRQAVAVPEVVRNTLVSHRRATPPVITEEVERFDSEVLYGFLQRKPNKLQFIDSYTLTSACFLGIAEIRHIEAVAANKGVFKEIAWQAAASHLAALCLSPDAAAEKPRQASRPIVLPLGRERGLLGVTGLFKEVSDHFSRAFEPAKPPRKEPCLDVRPNDDCELRFIKPASLLALRAYVHLSLTNDRREFSAVVVLCENGCTVNASVKVRGYLSGD